MRHYYQCLGATTISLHIPNFTFFTSPAVDEIMGVILKDNPEKLKSLHIREGSGTPAWPALVKYAQGHTEFPHLEELELCWDWGKKRLPETKLFRNSPRLQTLSLTGYKSRRIPLEFPWSQITTLKLSHVSVEYSLRLLVLCPNLVNYKFLDDSKVDGLWVPPQQQAISMQSVQKFAWISGEVSDVDGSDIQGRRQVDPQFFTHFRFPVVRNFRWDAPLPSDTPSVRDFLANMPELEELKTRLTDRDYPIFQYMANFANLTTLKVDIIPAEIDGMVSVWLWRLTIKSNKHHNHLPHLKRLHLRLDGEADRLMLVLYSRRYGPIDCVSPWQNLQEVALPLYDSTSTHWQHHARLLEFSVHPYCNPIPDWSSHYGTVKAMMLEAREVEGFGKQNDGRSRILF